MAAPPKKGPINPHERAIVHATVALHKGRPVPRHEVLAIGKVIHRSPEQIQRLIDDTLAATKQAAVSKLPDYLETHHASMKAAEEKGQHDTAIKAAQWALEHFGSNGQRVIEATGTHAKGQAIQIGIALGGVKKQGRTVIQQPVEIKEIDEVEETDEETET